MIIYACLQHFSGKDIPIKSTTIDQYRGIKGLIMSYIYSTLVWLCSPGQVPRSQGQQIQQVRLVRHGWWQNLCRMPRTMREQSPWISGEICLAVWVFFFRRSSSWALPPPPSQKNLKMGKSLWNLWVATAIMGKLQRVIPKPLMWTLLFQLNRLEVAKDPVIICHIIMCHLKAFQTNSIWD